MNQTYQDGMDLDLQERPSNPMGLVGFILAFCLPPIGLVLSLIALAWRPRGFAIAGVIIGLITTTVVAAIGVGVVRGGQQVAKFVQVGQAAEKMQTALAPSKGSFPADLGAAGISAENDPWGTPIKYEQTGGGAGYLLTSAGADTQFDTIDDIMIDPHTESEAMGILGGTSGFISMFGGEAKNAGRVMLDVFRLTFALEAIRTESGNYPASLEAIPGMSPKQMTDPWGTPYAYSVTTDGKSYSLHSNGPDKQPNTRDDISGDDMNRGFRQGRIRATSSTTVTHDPPTPPAESSGGEEAKPAGAEEKK